MIIKTILSTLVVSSILFANNIPDIYQKCVACHGKYGELEALKRSKIIAKMSKEDFVSAMRGYRDNTYGGLMKGMMKNQSYMLSDNDIELLYKYMLERIKEKNG